MRLEEDLEVIVHNHTDVKICALISVTGNRIHIQLVRIGIMEGLREAIELEPNEVTTVELYMGKDC